MLGSELDIRNCNILPPKRGESWRPPSPKFVRLSLEKVRGLNKNGGLQVFLGNRENFDSVETDCEVVAGYLIRMMD
jgi:hypothetical protein